MAVLSLGERNGEALDRDPLELYIESVLKGCIGSARLWLWWSCLDDLWQNAIKLGLARHRSQQLIPRHGGVGGVRMPDVTIDAIVARRMWLPELRVGLRICLLYTSPSPRDMRRSRMPSSA